MFIITAHQDQITHPLKNISIDDRGKGLFFSRYNIKFLERIGKEMYNKYKIRNLLLNF